MDDCNVSSISSFDRCISSISIYGKLQERQEQSQQELENASQNVSLLVIDKGMKLKKPDFHN